MILLFLKFSTSFEPPLGALPELYQKYESHMNFENQTFTCFDGKYNIPLSYINDNFADCEDGSDEPGTAAAPGFFYCKNNGLDAKIIPKWLVSDGNCDCCDGSDEHFNPHLAAPCFNTCSHPNNSSNLHLQKLSNIYQEGYIKKQDLISHGLERLKESDKSEIFSDFSFCDQAPPDFGESFLTSLWRFTFRGPIPQYSFLQAICFLGLPDPVYPTEISDLHFFLKSPNINSEMRRDETFIALISLYGQNYQKQDYSISIMKNAQVQESNLLPFYKYDNKKLFYKDNIDSLHVLLECSNSTNLIQCKGRKGHVCIFATPAACTQEDIQGLSILTPNQITEKLKLIEKL